MELWGRYQYLNKKIEKCLNKHYFSIGMVYTSPNKKHLPFYRFYLDIRILAKEKLVDGSGHRPHFRFVYADIIPFFCCFMTHINTYTNFK